MFLLYKANDGSCNTTYPEMGNETIFRKLQVSTKKVKNGPWIEPCIVVWSGHLAKVIEAHDHSLTTNYRSKRGP